MSKEKENNITIKIFALVIAIIMWSYVMSEVNPEITKEFRNIDVTFTNVEALESTGIVVLEPEEVTVNVEISGRRSDVVKITEDDIIAKIDLSGYGEGTRKVPIDVEVNSNRVRLVDYDAKVISFTFDSISRKEETVTVKTEGKLASGYVMGDMEINSSSVYIKGPKTLMNSISEIVAIADIAGRTTDINLTLPIKILDANGDEIKGIDRNPTMVEVHIPVYKIKTVPIEIQTEGQLPDGHKIINMNTYPKNVKIKGKKEVIDKINSIKTIPINIGSLIGNRNTPIELELPKGVELVDPEERINFTFNLESPEDDVIEEPDDNIETISFNYKLDEIEINNLESGLFIDKEESASNISITVRGLETKIKQLIKKDLTPEIDLKDLSEGTHNVKAKVKGLDGVELTNITPSKVKIVLKQE